MPYVRSTLMWPLQHVSRIVELLPPIGTAQEATVVGGFGIWVEKEHEGAAILDDRGIRLNWERFLVDEM